MKEWLYGKRTVFEHLRSLPDTCERLLISEGGKPDQKLLELAGEIGLAPERVKKEKLDNVSEGGNHQGVALRVGGWEYSDLDEIVDRVFKGECLPLIFVLDGVQDPRNLGAVVRVADGVGAAGVVIPKDRAAGITASAARSAAGALSTVPVAQVVNISRTLKELAKEGFFVAGADMGDQSLYDAKITSPAAIVLGAEGKGLRPNVAAKCQTLLSLPMEGKVESLNISVAAGVFAYEIRRRFKAS